MNARKILLVVFSVALLLAANLNVVYSVSVSGEKLSGVYSADQLKSGVTAACAAAEEIAANDITPAKYDKSAKLTFAAPDGSTLDFTRALLENTGGVDSAWSVLVGESEVGAVSDPTALGEVLDSILAEGAVHDAVAADFTEEITLRHIFVPEGKEFDLMALARAVRGATEVMSVTSDGTVRYG